MNPSTVTSIEEVVSRNLRAYLETIGKTHKWVYERAGMSKPTFYNLLKGKGDLKGGITRLNRVFRISDPTYFYKEDFKVPTSIQDLQSTATLKQQAAANYHALGPSPVIDETFETLEGIIAMLDVLHSFDEVEE
ncbi:MULTISPECIES: hypothetical protein [Exiguobacterium]|uniref:hypothetical protein n=1 Tax=Exiguobacterium TaxID=33986 RepID=UPI001AE317D0|nr:MULTISPECIES: hypothetical protein [Exiguobacterium]MCT4781397.1 hypothetical protein [Exiguobacterium soli]